MVRSSPRALLVWIALAAWLAGLALIAPMSHDEDQYVAAAMLAQRLRPFVDFMHMQTPLQAELFRHVVAAVPGHAFIALRLANATCALATLWCVRRAQLRLGVAPGPAWTATLALAGCASFAFTASVARNDALPTLLLSVAMLVAVDARGRGGWLVAGLLLGLASSAKISFALPAAALGVWLAIAALRAGTGAGNVLAFGAGGLVGLIPAVLAWRAAPAAFTYGVIGFATEAVFDWYRQNGLDAKLTQGAKLVALPWLLMQGPGLFALGLVVWRRRSLPRAGAPVVALCLGGLVAAAAPTPVWTQYLAPLLPPLFVLAGVTLAGLRPPWARRASIAMLLLAAGGAVGYTASGVRDWQRGGAPAALRVTREARWIGATLHAHGIADGAIATLTASVAIDSGFAIDPRFAGGAQLFRSADLRSDAQAAAFNIVGPRTLARAFAAAPPVAIVTGYEGRSTINARVFPDDALTGWARTHGYAPLASPVGRATLWIRP